MQRTDELVSIDGKRQSGADARVSNVSACVAIANIVKSSFGPIGLDKMLVDSIGDVLITNDGATILQQLEVEHPAAKVLVELAQLQDQDVGDGTTGVVIFAAELLRRANELIHLKISPASIIAGFRLASKEAVKYVKKHLTLKIEDLDDSALQSCARTSISSKVLNMDSDFFSDLCVRTMRRVKVGSGISARYPVGAVNVLKAQGKGIRETEMIEGFALNCTRASAQMPRRVEGAKIALLTLNLSKTRMKQGASIHLTDPEKLKLLQREEGEQLKRMCAMILDAGANVVITSNGMDDMAQKYLVSRGAIGIRRARKEDLNAIAKATNATIVTSLVSLEGELAFEASNLGTADEVRQVAVGDAELMVLSGCSEMRTASIILRGPNSYMLDEMERALHDALCVMQRTMESGRVVPGGGAVETALAIYLDNFAGTLSSRQQIAVGEFAQALLSIPKVLSVNAAQDAADMVAELYASHKTAQTDSAQADLWKTGLNLIDGSVGDNVAAGILEPAMAKVKYIQYATEACVSILRIDEVVTLNPKQEQQQ